MKNGVTIKDIAESLNITTASVSYVLSGNKSKVAISEETKRKVFQSAWDMKYKTQRNIILNMPIFSGTVPVFLDFVISLINRLEEAGYGLTIKVTEYDATLLEKSIDEAFLTRKASGLVFIENLPENLEQKLIDLRIPYVIVNSLRESDRNQVICDEKRGMKILLEHCLAKGYRKISFLAKNTSHYHSAPWHQNRKRAYLEFCEEKGLENNFYEWEPNDLIACLDQLIECEGKQMIISDLVNNLEIALQLKYHHKSYPEDLGLAGVAYPFEADALKMTALQVPFHDMGIKTSAMILRMIDEDIHSVPTEYCATELIDRGSC